MGGGHVSRPDFGMPQPDPAYPLTEFYLLLQHALDKAGRFALPALYARVQAPARQRWAESWLAQRRTSAGCTIRRPRPSLQNGWPCCREYIKGDFHKFFLQCNLRGRSAVYRVNVPRGTRIPPALYRR